MSIWEHELGLIEELGTIYNDLPTGDYRSEIISDAVDKINKILQDTISQVENYE